MREYFDPRHLAPLLDRLGVQPADRHDLLAHAARLDEADLTAVAGAAAALGSRLGHWSPPSEPVFASWPDQPGRPRGLIPMLALLATVEPVRKYHAARAIGAAQTYAALADLGQQLWVFRQTFDAFGLDTAEWLVTAWSGAFFWLGRLQFNLLPYAGGHVISVHIPQTGPLHPERVDESFARARCFFATHFPDAPVHALHCDSWLLDPRLARVLEPESNLVRFQRRWRLLGEPRVADAATIYFVFRRRGRPGTVPDRTGLPRRTSLQREVLDHLEAGGHWYAYTGLIDLT